MTTPPAKRVFLDYYKARNIIPTRQDLTELDRHFRRRRALYLSLGIPPQLLAEKRVIEFGPGSGDNAIYTASLDPKEYVFVDANQASVDAVNNKIQTGQLGKTKAQVVKSEMLNYQTESRFDLVIAEAVIPGQDHPEKYLTHIAQFVAQGGIIIQSNNSCTSMFPEVCRRMIKPFVTGLELSFKKQIEFLVDFFQEDLSHLRGMSRLAEDWVLDVILHPWKAVRFTISDALFALENEFDFLGSSPRFLSDWRWYKQIDGKDPGINTLAIDQYRSQSGLLMDYRHQEGISDIDGERLEAKCQKAFDTHIEIWNRDDISSIPEFLEMTCDIADYIQIAMPKTSKALRDYANGMDGMLSGQFDADFGTFRELFGRGQQYASFIRRSETQPI